MSRGRGASDSSAPIAYGVDVGGTKLLAVALCERATVVAESRGATPVGTADEPEGAVAGEQVADAIAEAVTGLRRAHGPGSVGIGIPGMLDGSGVLRCAPNLPEARGSQVGALVSARLGGERVHVANDANCAAVCEVALGAARGARHALFVALGTGIGGALIVDGRVQEGAHGFAGEVGHMVVDPSGPPCPCGARGCWERYASGAGLARLAREAALAGTVPAVVALAGGDPELVRGEHVTSAAAAGDSGALHVLDELGWWLARGLANLVAVLDPELVVVGGGLGEAGDMLLAPARRAYAELVEGGLDRPEVPIVAAAFGERAGAIGAALLGRAGGRAVS